MGESVKLIFLSDDNQNSRLDFFLKDKLPEYSRSFMQKLIKNGHVVVNNNITTKPGHLLKELDEVLVDIVEDTKVEALPAKVAFDIVDIQEDFVVVNKPAGLVVHPAPSCKTELTLVHGLLYEFSELSEFNDSERPGIIHRLDRNTSGLIVIARNALAKSKLSDLFKNRQVSKKYLAVVDGHPPESGKIDYPIGRHPSASYKMSHVGFCSRPALTKYKVVEYFKKHSLVEVQILTGRTHQIRVHFAALGHGLVGDEVYNSSSHLIGRQALHAWQLSFSLNGKDYFYQVEPPKDFEKLITFLRSQSI